MTFTRTAIPDVILIDPKVHGDARGYFVETFRADKLEAFLGFNVPFCQDNESSSSYGVLRGLHYQLPPHAQSKLVRVIEGEVLDVAVDVRTGSPTFGKFVAVELSEENKLQLFIPKGFAHGFLTLSEDAVFQYKCDSYFIPNHEGAFRWNDTTVNIPWPIDPCKVILSDKDKTLPTFEKAIAFSYADSLY